MPKRKIDDREDDDIEDDDIEDDIPDNIADENCFFNILHKFLFSFIASDYESVDEKEGKMDEEERRVYEEERRVDEEESRGDEEERRVDEEEGKMEGKMELTKSVVEDYVFITAGCHGSMKKILLKNGDIVDDSVNLHLNPGSTFTKKTIADPGEGAMVLLCSLRNIAPVQNKAETPRGLPRTHADVEAYIKNLTPEQREDLKRITGEKLFPVNNTQNNYDIKQLSKAIINDFIKKGEDFKITYPTQEQILEINARTNSVFDVIMDIETPKKTKKPKNTKNPENTEDRIKQSHTVKIQEGLTKYWTSYYSSSSYGGLVISFILEDEMKSYDIFVLSDIETLQDDLKSQLSDDMDIKELDSDFGEIIEMLTDVITQDNYDKDTDKFHWVSTLELFKIIECIQRALPSKTKFFMTDLACKTMQDVTSTTAKKRVGMNEEYIGYGGFRKNKSKKNKSKKNKSKKNKSKKNKSKKNKSKKNKSKKNKSKKNKSKKNK